MFNYYVKLVLFALLITKKTLSPFRTGLSTKNYYWSFIELFFNPVNIWNPMLCPSLFSCVLCLDWDITEQYWLVSDNTMLTNRRTMSAQHRVIRSTRPLLSSRLLYFATQEPVETLSVQIVGMTHLTFQIPAVKSLLQVMNNNMTVTWLY